MIVSYKYMFAALTGFIALLLLTILQLDALDTALSVSIYALAIALPFSAGAVIANPDIDPEVTDKHYLEKLNIHSLLQLPALISSIVALVAAFWHFSVLAALICAISTLLVFWIIIRQTDLHIKP